MEFFVITAIIAMLFGVSFFLIHKVKHGFSAKKAIRLQLTSFVVTLLLGFSVPFVVSAAGSNSSSTGTSQSEVVEDEKTSGIGAGIAMLGAAIAFGLSTLGAGLALANSTPAAITAMSENPKTFGKSLVLVALAESLPILGMVVSLMMMAKF